MEGPRCKRNACQASPPRCDAILSSPRCSPSRVRDIGWRRRGCVHSDSRIGAATHRETNARQEAPAPISFSKTIRFLPSLNANTISIHKHNYLDTNIDSTAIQHNEWLDKQSLRFNSEVIANV